MKKYISLLSIVVIAIGWTACSETSNGPGCRIKGYLSFKEYKKVYLTDNSENRIDSCEVKDGRFYLEEKGNISEPYVAIIHMTAEQDSTDYTERCTETVDNRDDPIRFNTHQRGCGNILRNADDGLSPSGFL